MAEVQDQRPKEWRRASGLVYFGITVRREFLSVFGSVAFGLVRKERIRKLYKLFRKRRRWSPQSFNPVKQSILYFWNTFGWKWEQKQKCTKGQQGLLQDSSTSRFAQALWGHFKKPTRPGMRSHSRCWFIESPNLLRGCNFKWFQSFGDWHVHNQFAYLTWFLSTRDFRFQAGWVRLEMGWAAGHIPRRSLELFTKKEATC